MIEREIASKLKVYNNMAELPKEDFMLLNEARQALAKSYSPYSGFKVGAAMLLANGAIVSAANQENAAYPMCVCAEVAVLNAANAIHSGVAIQKIAITTQHVKHPTTSPAAPCGQCRQTILEYEMRYDSDIVLIMAGEQGEVYEVSSVKSLLPLHFSSKDL